MTTIFISVAGAAAAATSCWEHLPSHSPLPLRRSARAFGGCSGHSLLECAVFECRELMPELVESIPGDRTAVLPNCWAHLPSHNLFLFGVPRGHSVSAVAVAIRFLNALCSSAVSSCQSLWKAPLGVYERLHVLLSCYWAHLPSHNMFPLRHSARGHSMSAVAICFSSSSAVSSGLSKPDGSVIGSIAHACDLLRRGV
jgi:hypothetical protein